MWNKGGEIRQFSTMIKGEVKAKSFNENQFKSINKGYTRVFHSNRLSVGLVVPVERYDSSPVPTMENHLERVQLAEQLGFSAVWLRDVPFNVPSFGDAGQLFDPFVYLGFLAAQTQTIALGVASIVLPLRHPAHVAKAAASLDVLSRGRIILGVASGDRPQEYPALNLSYANRGERFRESYNYIRDMASYYPALENYFGNLHSNIDMLPKPVSKRIPLLITGGGQQSPQWIAEHGDGWMIYPRDVAIQAKIIQQWRHHTEQICRLKPLMEPLYVDLSEDPELLPQPIHLGLRLGVKHLVGYLKSRKEIGVNHVAINLRFNKADIKSTMKRLADEVLPAFHN